MPALGLSEWLITLAVAGVFLLLLLTVEIKLTARRRRGPTRAAVEIRILTFRFCREFNAEAILRKRMRLLIDRALEARDGSEQADDPLKQAKTALADPERVAVDRSRVSLWLDLLKQARQAAGPPSRYVRRRVQCRRLLLHLEVGTGDAMETALLCGGAWSAVGSTASLVGSIVRLAPGAPDLRVQPNFDTQCLRLRGECILRVRVAHAMIAAIWFGSRFLREKGLVARMRDRRFKKGVVHDGRTPDSGAAENGHGVAQDDGGRQHGRR